MNREKLIAYSVYYSGEYKEIMKAIRFDLEVPSVEIGNAITLFDDAYPKRLLDLKYPPFVLYYKGNLDLLNRECIAVVGSRDPCEYALKATRSLMQAKKDRVVISGLAKGIDACAHLNAAQTIGILGCGIDRIYPRCNASLIHDIAENGLILSEYPANVKPLAYHFPFRNRLIACLSETIYVMQSNSRSGTMTTVNEGLELGKDIRVLPYDVFNHCGINNNHLIYEGAQPIEYEEIAI